MLSDIKSQTFNTRCTLIWTLISLIIVIYSLFLMMAHIIWVNRRFLNTIVIFGSTRKTNFTVSRNFKTKRKIRWTIRKKIQGSNLKRMCHRCVYWCLLIFSVSEFFIVLHLVSNVSDLTLESKFGYPQCVDLFSTHIK